MRWEELFGTDDEKEPKETPVAANEPAANYSEGWHQSRRWISKAPAPKSRRSGIVPTLYSWTGYRDGTHQDRRSWAKEEQDDKE